MEDRGKYFNLRFCGSMPNVQNSLLFGKNVSEFVIDETKLRLFAFENIPEQRI